MNIEHPTGNDHKGGLFAYGFRTILVTVTAIRPGFAFYRTYSLP